MNICKRANFTKQAFALMSFVGLVLFSETAHAGCADLVVKFTENKSVDQNSQLPLPQPGNQQDSKVEPRSVTGVFFCSGSNYEVPELSSMHFVYEKEGQTCYRDMSCGNTNAWSVYLGVSGVWSHFDSFSQFLASPDFLRIKSHHHGTGVNIDLSVEWGHVERYCHALSAEMCL